MTSSLVQAVSRFVGDILDAAFGGSDPLDEEEQARLRRTVWRLERDYAKASQGASLDDLVGGVTRAVQDGREALLAWLDLLEDIVQLAEQRFGTRPGNGPFKAAQVNAAIRRLLQRGEGRSAVVVQILGPDAIDLFTGWLIDVTVALLNNNSSLWQAGDADRRIRIPLRTRFIAAVVRILAKPLAWFSSTTPLDPSLYADVERIAKGPGSPFLVIDRAIDLVGWMAEHREQTLALVDLVSSACDEVEYFMNLEGAEKQAYARNLVLVTLTVAGLNPSGAVYGLAGAATDLLIDFIVATNNKHGRYVHRR
jgi:hypothetical protein